MNRSYWHRQEDKPLFPELLWSRPENRLAAGKLFIIGGNVHHFTTVAESYQIAMDTGLGTARVLLPDALQKTVGKVFEAGDFVSSTPSGSFARQALAPILDASVWADAILIAGDLGRNAETAILLESLLQRTNLPMVISQDAINYITATPQAVKERSNTTLVLSLSQLQHLTKTIKFTQAVTFSMGTAQLVDWLHAFTTEYPIYIVTEHLNTILVACNGDVSTTKLKQEMPIWRTTIAAKASVWWLQNKQKPFAALTTAVVSDQE
ncbi:MAG TPA: hypothetical protein VGS08_00630 [Candidatus Saccharimonadales bacterium]|nr:hypothetical protein [Candidatus Saccharimonadales bacterium]